MGNKEKRRRRPAAATRDTVCPHCNKLNVDAGDVCHYCGRKLRR